MTIIDVVTLITSFITAIGLILVAWQIRESEKSRHLQATWTIFDFLGSEENRSLRRFVYNELPEKVNDFSSDTLAKVERVCGSFERAALITNRGLVRKDIILANYVEAFIMCWEKLQPFILSARKQRGDDLYMIEFEQMASDAKKYWKKYQKGKPLPHAYTFPLNAPQDSQSRIQKRKATNKSKSSV